jgi:succinoglycan biosynthesis protein ExoM
LHRAALASLTAQSLPRDKWDLILVGVAPEPAYDLSAAVELFGPCTMIENTESASRSREAAVEAASTPLVAFLDDDSTAEPRWLEALVAAFGTYGEDAFAVAGRIKAKWGGSRPGWLHEDLSPFLSCVDHGAELRPLTLGERVASGNLAVRKNAFPRLRPFFLQIERAAAFGLAGVDDAALLVPASPAKRGAAIFEPAATVQRPMSANRLTQRWLMRRAAWQAAVDREFGPTPSDEDIARRWRAAKRFMLERPPTERTIRGLVAPQREPNAFLRQVKAVYDNVYCLLSGVRESADG